MKRFILFGLSVFLACSVLVNAAPSASAASWADSYLQNLVRREVMRGDISGNLDPDRYVTRAEFAAMMNRAFGFTVRGNKTFKDVPSTAWFAADLDIASTQGYLQGDGKGVNPNGNLTREEAVTLLCRALKIAPQEGEGFHLTDERNFSNWSRGYINAAVRKTFVSGYPDGSFRPANRITRGEAAKLLSEVAGEIVTTKNSNQTGVINGNATINSSGLTLSNVTVLGDLYLTEGVGLGYVALKNVTVSGELVISGAGESNVGKSSVILTDCNISNLVVDVAKQKILTLKTDKSSVVENTLVKSSTYLEELSNNFEGFKNVNLNGPSGTFLNLTGSFGDVRMMSPGSVLNLYKGKVTGLTVDEKAKGAKIFLEKDTYTTAMYFDTGATVSGKGQIESVLINNDGVVIEQLPQNIYIRPGVTAKIDGKTMGSLDAEMDALSPDFSYGYPKADKIQPTTFTQYYMTNKPGKVYYAVYPAGTNMPSKDELMAKNAPPKNAIKSGNLSTLPAKEGSVPISSLKAGQQYVVYSYFVDFRGGSSDIKRTNVETVDNVMPILLSGYPKLLSTDSTSATFTVLPNKDTSYYWAVLAANAVAPTSDQLYAQNISGALAKGVTFSGKMNTQTNIDTGKTLQEFVPYVFYVVLRDGAENMSKTPYKLAFTTKDATAPKFQPDDGTYPKVGAVTANSIPLAYVVNEPCTVYWSAVKMGTNLLPLDDKQKPDLGNQKSKDLIKNGTGAFKTGKSTATKEGQLYNLSVSGLEQQMPYDIYFMLEDKSGNQSTITMITAKTKDIIPPTVSITNAPESDGKYGLNASMTLTFSEIVCCDKRDSNGDYMLLSKLFNEDKTPLKASLEPYMSLGDTSKVPNATMPINWNYVTVEEKDAKTVITFQPKALNLVNNNSYQFELNNQTNYAIYDTSKNAMKTSVKLPFRTVPPKTYFSPVPNFDSSLYDHAFFMNPTEKNTEANIKFDILLRTDHQIEFKLYQGDSMADLEEVEKGTTKVLRPTSATRFTDFLGTQKEYLDRLTEYQDVKPTYYAIKLTKVDSTPIEPGKTPITANVNLIMNAVIGNDSGIGRLPGPASDFDARLKDAIKNNYVSSVTEPEPFQLQIALVDNVAPKLKLATEFEPGDRQVLMRILPDKGCTVYYYAVPEPPTPLDIKDPNLVRLQSSDPSRGIAAGSFQVPDNRLTHFDYTIEGLLPPSSGFSGKYQIFYFLQGKAATPSEVYPSAPPFDLGGFTTKQVAKPEIKQPLSLLADKNAVQIKGSWDSDCRMYYLVLPATAKDPSVEQIMGKESIADMVTSGSLGVQANTIFSLDIKDLNYKYRYNFYAVAQKYIGTAPAGEPSLIKELKGFTCEDGEAPQISSKPVGPANPDKDDPTRFTGSVLVSFTEGLYYFQQGSANTIALEGDKLEGLLQIASTAPGSIKVDSFSVAGEDKAIMQVTFSFTSIVNGTTINIGPEIGDKAGNPAGKFTMTFHSKDDKGNPILTPYWEARFAP